jgi:uncharacterized protein YegP (UPF0339 family)
VRRTTVSIEVGGRHFEHIFIYIGGTHELIIRYHASFDDEFYLEKNAVQYFEVFFKTRNHIIMFSCEFIERKKCLSTRNGVSKVNASTCDADTAPH